MYHNSIQRTEATQNHSEIILRHKIPAPVNWIAFIMSLFPCYIIHKKLMSL
ncbi:yae1 domain-containing protein 1-like [Iris pallida]|uniref:Yae1 domain-containing protein 1-like n=1 Tax=Iris pallida TaxID=29817 RepID=A0AAX6H515_IRIPA|nr:yae1 domain-containing protein 1-like [Iris pallida]